jgi:hypothetical protein
MHNRLEPASSALRLGGAVSSRVPVRPVAPCRREEFLDIHRQAANEIARMEKLAPHVATPSSARRRSK